MHIWNLDVTITLRCQSTANLKHMDLAIQRKTGEKQLFYVFRQRKRRIITLKYLKGLLKAEPLNFSGTWSKIRINKDSIFNNLHRCYRGTCCHQ